jgi:P27 family predicted phage terminase small subunit
MRGRKPNSIRTAPEDAITKAPRAPAWLSDFAREEWKRVTPILVERGVLTNADLGSLENYVTAIGVIRECQMALTRDGMFVRDQAKSISPGMKPDGSKALQFDKMIDKGFKRHPAIGVMHTSQTVARQLAAELGLTPVSRSRPNITDARDLDGDNPLDL